MRLISVSSLFFLAFTLTACATSRGFDREALRRSVTGDTAKQVTDEDIRQALESRAQLSFPFRLAIYLKPQSKEAYRSYYQRSDLRWSAQDRATVSKFGEELRERGMVSDVVLLNDTIVSADDLKTIRLGAARAGADAVLVVSSAHDVDEYNNPLGPLYIMIVTGLFVPGSELDALVLLSASMWDVRNSYLYLAAEAEGIAHQTRPAAFIRDSRALEDAKTDALNGLLTETRARLTNLRSKQ